MSVFSPQKRLGDKKEKGTVMTDKEWTENGKKVKASKKNLLKPNLL